MKLWRMLVNVSSVKWSKNWRKWKGGSNRFWKQGSCDGKIVTLRKKSIKNPYLSIFQEWKRKLPNHPLKGREYFRSLENQCGLMIFDVGPSRLMEYYLEICSSHATIRGFTSKAAFGDGAEDRGWKTKPRRGDLTWMYRILFYHK